MSFDADTPPEMPGLDFTRDDDTKRIREKMAGNHVSETLGWLVKQQLRRQGSESIIKWLLAAALGVGTTVGGALILMKVDIATLTARVDDLARAVEHLAR